MNKKLLDNAREAGFEVVTTYAFAGTRIVNKELTKFAELQIPEGYKLAPIEPAEDELDKSAKLRLSFKSDTGYNVISDYKITLEQWSDVLKVCAGTLKSRTTLTDSLPINTEEG